MRRRDARGRPCAAKGEATPRGSRAHPQKPEVEPGAAPEVIGTNIHLRDLRLRRHECFVWKVGPKQQQHVALVHSMVGCPAPDQTGHADLIRIVVFDEMLAAKSVSDRSFQSLGECQQRVVCTGAPASAEERWSE